MFQTVTDLFSGLNPPPKAGIYILAIVTGLAVIPIASALTRCAAALPDARRTRQERVALIDTFSQYGQGPMLMTWLAFVLIEPNLHAANVMAQLHSMALYGCVPICMSRITPHRLAALWLGFFAVGVLLSG